MSFLLLRGSQDKAYNETNELVKHHVKQSLKALDLSYIDLYLIHFPLESNEENLRVWRILETFVRSRIDKIWLV